MAYMNDVIEKNPMDKVIRPKPRKDEIKNNEIEAYTATEVAHIMDCLASEPLKWQAIIRLLIDTGIRRGECCGLQWYCVDFDNNTIMVANNLCYTPQKGVYLDTPKNGKTRTIDVDPDVMKMLRQLRKDQIDNGIISQYVFTQDGTALPMHPQSPTRYMSKFAKRYGVQDFHPHKLRHSYASIAITNGADVASVSENLGHSDKAVTLRMYTHADTESKKRASQIVRDALKQKQA
jgi:integrase